MSQPENVTCACCGQQEPPVGVRVPFGEPTRGEILARVGAPCWRTWLDTQLMIINEYRLNLSDPASREMLDQAARQFLKLDGGAAEVLETGPDKARELGNLKD
jgi:Fe-S cluster biosynthesis and repair protein YggX